jgi:hypothetical protein
VTATRTAATAETLEVLEAAQELVCSWARRPAEQRAPDQPPMCITAADADFAVDVLDRALARAH